MGSPLNVATAGHIQIWTINRPDVGNAITGLDIIEALEEAVYAANADTEVRAVILTGRSHLSAGGNVKDMADRQGMFGVDERAQRRAYVAGIQRIPRAMQRLEVPIIAAVNGAAIGAGLDLAMMCDLRVASDRGSSRRVSSPDRPDPGDGGTWFLPRAIGWERAAEMTFTGEPIDAATALEWGLVSRVVPHDTLMAEAERLAERIAKNPGEALRMAKRLLQESQAGSLESVLGMAAAMQPLAHRDPEHADRIAKWRTEPR